MLNGFQKGALFCLVIPAWFIPVNSQTVSQSADTLTKAGTSRSSGIQTQRILFERFLRAKYAFADSISRIWTHRGGSYLRFEIPRRNLPGFRYRPIYPELHYRTWEEDFRKRASGGYEQLLMNPTLLGTTFNESDKWERSRRGFQNRLIPSNLQLDVLRVLWTQTPATQLDIYAGLDPSYPITAQELNRQLERMVALGLVERKIISPQHLFTILSPLKAFQVEMSAKNRKNRVYLYRPRVTRKAILQLLLARYDRVKNDGVGRISELTRLSEKFRIVLSNHGG